VKEAVTLPPPAPVKRVPGRRPGKAGDFNARPARQPSPSVRLSRLGGASSEPDHIRRERMPLVFPRARAQCRLAFAGCSARDRVGAKVGGQIVGAYWDNAVKNAKKVLGDKAKVPDFPKSIPKSMQELNKTWDQFDKDREQLKKSLLVVKQKQDSTMEVFEQFEDEIDEDDFGLDTKNKDDLAKIKDGRKILHDALQVSIDNGTDNNKNLRELDKHLMNLMTYTLNCKET